jgi:hypothetical protein
MKPPPTLGSTSWDGADAYEVGGELHQRATTFFTAIKWDQLISLSSRLREGIPCSFGEKFSIGHFNMVRRIVFADGVSWVARLRLPRLASLGDREALDDASILKAESVTESLAWHMLVAAIEISSQHLAIQQF